MSILHDCRTCLSIILLFHKMASTQRDVRESIVRKYTENPNLSHNTIAKHLKVPKSTVTSVLKKYKETLSIDKKSGSGRKKGFESPETAAKVVNVFKRNPSLSVRDVAKKVNMSSSYVQKVRQQAGLQSFKVKIAPNRNDKQNKAAKTRARKLYDKVIHKYDCVVMDDETYVKADFKQLPGQQFYTSKKRGDVPDKFKHKKLDKFSKKYLIWQAICTCGLKSKAFITTGTVNQEIYVNKCLKKCLLPFINSHDKSVLFWPDLATAHYGKYATEWYKENGISVVAKDTNPPNCPQLRPIERFWAIMKRKLLKTKKCVKNEKDLLRYWNQVAKTVTETDVQRLMKGVKSKIRKFAYKKI